MGINLGSSFARRYYGPSSTRGLAYQHAQYSVSSLSGTNGSYHMVALFCRVLNLRVAGRLFPKPAGTTRRVGRTSESTGRRRPA